MFSMQLSKERLKRAQFCLDRVNLFQMQAIFIHLKLVVA